MAKVYAILKFLEELWVQIKIFIGMIEKAEHDHKQKEIDDTTKKAGDITLSEEERRAAAKKLEDLINGRT